MTLYVYKDTNVWLVNPDGTFMSECCCQTRATCACNSCSPPLWETYYVTISGMVDALGWPMSALNGTYLVWNDPGDANACYWEDIWPAGTRPGWYPSYGCKVYLRWYGGDWEVWLEAIGAAWFIWWETNGGSCAPDGSYSFMHETFPGDQSGATVVVS